MDRTLRLGIQVEPDLDQLGRRLVEELPERLRERFPGIEWRVELGQEVPKDPTAKIAELVQEARRWLLDEGWDLVVCLTRLPLRSKGRPVAAHASPTDGVGLISVPALGPVGVDDRALEAVIDLIAGLVGARDGEGQAQGRLDELATPIGHVQVRDDRTFRFTTAVIRGNLRLLAGMVRANHPWRVVVRLSRAMVAALGTAAYVIASTGFWPLAPYMSWQRLLGLAVAAVVGTVVTLIVAHDLWERSRRAETRERVVLFNAVTAITVGIGVLTLYLALFVFSVIAVFGLVPEESLRSQTHSAQTGDYLRLAWLAASMATLAGALGSMVESDLAVREAAYGYRPEVDEANEDDEADGS